jgi:hypothetical protein
MNGGELRLLLTWFQEHSAVKKSRGIQCKLEKRFHGVKDEQLDIRSHRLPEVALASQFLSYRLVETVGELGNLVAIKSEQRQ